MMLNSYCFSWVSSLGMFPFGYYFSVDCFVIDDIGNMVSKLQIFNEFNARKPDEFNIFKGVTKNYLFMGIVGLTVVLQVSFARASPVV